MHSISFDISMGIYLSLEFKSNLSLEQGAIDFDLWKQKSFGPGQIDTALSRVRTYDNLYCRERFQKSAIKVNKDVLLEYERLKQNDIISTMKRNNISDNYSLCS